MFFYLPTNSKGTIETRKLCSPNGVLRLGNGAVVVKLYPEVERGDPVAG